MKLHCTGIVMLLTTWLLIQFAIPASAQVLQLPSPETATTAIPAADAHYQNGVAYGEQGRFIEAASELAQAVRLNPGHVEAHFYLGEAYAELGQFDHAITELRRVLLLQPNDVDAHYDLCRLHMQRNEFELAREHARAVERLDARLAQELFVMLKQRSAPPRR